MLQSPQLKRLIDKRPSSKSWSRDRLCLDLMLLWALGILPQLNLHAATKLTQVSLHAIDMQDDSIIEPVPQWDISSLLLVLLGIAGGLGLSAGSSASSTQINAITPNQPLRADSFDVFQQYSFMLPHAGDHQYTLTNFNQGSAGLVATAYASSTSASPILAALPVINGANFEFSLKPNAELYAADIVTLNDSMGTVLQIPIINGTIQSIASAPSMNAVVDPAAAATVSVPVTKLAEFGSSFTLLVSTNSLVGVSGDKGSYQLRLSSAETGVLNFTGELNAQDEKALSLWNNDYYFDRFDISIQAQSGSSTHYHLSINGQTILVSADLTIELDVSSSDLRKPYLEIVSDDRSIVVGTDPLYAEQVLYQHAHIPQAWALGYSGKNIKIAMIETGVDVDHEDLFSNIDYAHSLASTGSSAHGTNVSGIAASMGANGVGSIGVAPDSSVVFRGYTFDSALFEIEGLAVINNSWGPPDATGMLFAMPSADASFIKTAATDHDMWIFFANGNGGPSDLSNYDGYVNSIYTLGVQSLNATGQALNYAENGSSIVGSFYVDNALYTATPRGIATLAENNQYIDNFSGTSAATPMACGIAALMLDANPSLNWRDCINIFANVAVNNDLTNPNWQKNIAGIDYHPTYGFGAILADSAVTAALDLDYQISDSSLLTTTVSEQAITERILVADADNEIIEFVTVTIDIPHGVVEQEQLNIYLYHNNQSALSKSTLATAHNVNDTLNYDGWEFNSVVHWGESRSGEWYLDIKDSSNNAVDTALWDYDLDFYYHLI